MLKIIFNLLFCTLLTSHLSAQSMVRQAFSKLRQNEFAKKHPLLVKTGGAIAACCIANEGYKLYKRQQEKRAANRRQKIIDRQNEKNRRLWKAITDDDLAGTIDALQQGAQPNAINPDVSKNALIMATSNYNSRHMLPIVQHLIRAGAQVNSQETVHGTTPLGHAAKAGNLSVVRELLQANAQINQQNSYGQTALSVAASAQSHIVQALIDAGADHTIADKNGDTPLMNANLATTKILLIIDKRTLNAQNKDSETALMLAASEGQLDRAELLLNAGADIHIIGSNKRINRFNALTIAALKDQRNDAMIKLLLSYGARYLDFEKDKDGHSALHRYAQRENTLHVLQNLIRCGAPIDEINYHGSTPLIIAADNGNIEGLQTLIAARADVNTANNHGATALTLTFKSHKHPDCASYYLTPNNLLMVQALINAGTNVNMQDERGDAALFFAIYRLGELMAARHNPLLHEPQRRNDIAQLHSVIQELLNANANVDLKKQNGDTALMEASWYGQHDVIAKLLKYNADVHATNNEGITALMYAIGKNNQDIIATLMLAGADVDDAWLARQNAPLIQAGVRSMRDRIREEAHRAAQQAPTHKQLTKLIADYAFGP